LTLVSAAPEFQENIVQMVVQRDSQPIHKQSYVSYRTIAAMQPEGVMSEYSVVGWLGRHE
jgi:hypothetical protein